jgi:seryl-tRNA synthetase
MFDVKWIRDNAEAFDAGLAKRGLEPASGDIIALDAKRRDHIVKLQDAQNRRNAASKEIGAAKAGGDDDKANALIAEIAELKEFLQTAEETARKLNDELREALSGLPNLPLDDVPVGEDETDNVELEKVGRPPVFDFEPKQHFELGEALGLMDFETAAGLSGARFVILKGRLARLERSLAQFMLDIHTGEFGYTEISPPLLVNSNTMFGTAQLPKFADDQFRTEDGLWLIPTAEVPLTNLAREAIRDEALLPLRYTAYTPCFRLEAGAAGRDTRGMIRQHQFSKVELVSLVRPEDGAGELERMRNCAEEILKRLGIAYRTMLLATGDMGFAARKTYDLEVWLPGQNAYREISSCSLCGDFQARRMNARYRPVGEKQTRFLHTLNGSGLAVGRTLVALMENFQDGAGVIHIPEILQPYTGFGEITPA